MRLENTGISAIVFGGTVVRSMDIPQLGPPMLFPVELRVHAKDAQRALEALKSGAEE